VCPNESKDFSQTLVSKYSGPMRIRTVPSSPHSYSPSTTMKILWK
jgi:hypothetical protein